MERTEVKNQDLHLDYQQKLINDKDVQQIITRKTQNTKKISLARNMLRWRGIYYFSRANWENLLWLNLSFNTIGDKGLFYLSSTKSPKLQLLWLKKNQISSLGLIHLSKVDWKAIQKLSLSMNSINIDGGLYLSKMNTPKMSQIFLSNNNMNLQQLKKLVAYSSQICVIDLHKNKIQDRQKKQLKLYFTNRWPKIQNIFV